MQRSRQGSNRNQKRERDNRQRKYSNSDSEQENSHSQERMKYGGRRDSNSSESRSVSRSRSRSRSEESAERPRGNNRNQQRNERKSGDDCSELFVRNLPWKADEEAISDFFGKFGKVENVKILYNRETGKAKGIGFVDYASREDAQNAIDNADQLEMEGRKLEVTFSNQKPDNNNRGSGRDNNRDFKRREGGSQESNTIFVGNLDFKTSENSIRDFFEDCGNIVDVRIAKTPEGKNKGFCHVEFESTDAASKAMRKSGENIDGRDIRVDFSSQRQGGGNFNRDRGFGSRGGFRGGNSISNFFSLIKICLFSFLINFNQFTHKKYLRIKYFIF